MAIIFEDNFETANLSKWTGQVGSPTVQNTVVNSGNWAMGCSNTAQFNYATKTFSAITRPHLRAYVRITGYPAPDPNLGISMLDISQNAVWGNMLFHFDVTNPANTGTYFGLTYRNGAGFSIVLLTDAILLNEWYCVEIGAVVAVQGLFYVWVNDVLKLTITNVDNTLFSANGMLVGNNFTITPYTGMVYIDNLVLADDEYIGMKKGKRDEQTTSGRVLDFARIRSLRHIS